MLQIDSVTLSTAPRTQPVAIVGAGRVGVSLGTLLRRAGYQLAAFTATSKDSLDRAAQWLSCPGYLDPREAVAKAGLVIIAVPDDALAAVASEIAGAIRPGSFVLHTSGSHGRSVLGPVAEAGARSLAIHVLQSIPTVEAGVERIGGSFFGVSCEEDLRGWAAELVGDLGGVPIWISEEDRPTYHLAAAVASNFLVTLAMAVEEIFGDLRPYLPLMRGTISNLDSLSPADALTGPVVRGDHSTLERHLHVIPEDLSDLYRLLSLTTLRYAGRSRRLSDEKAQALAELLGSGGEQ